MNKQELRAWVRQKKRAMTVEEIEARSAALAEKFCETDFYRNAKTIYGYLPYNQEVRTVPMLEQAMRDGKRVDSFPISETNTEQLVEKMVGAPVKNFYTSREANISDEEVLRVEDYTRWGFFHHLNFSLRKGEVLAICGLAGSGRTEIARSIISADLIDQGKLFVHGKEVHFKNIGDAIKGGVGYLTEDRKVVGLALNQDVSDNVLSCVVDRYSKAGLFQAKKHRGLVQEKIDEMAVYPADPDRLVNSFSGGNQQKVLMAKWLAADVDVLILDEPTRGIDVGAKKEIHQLMSDLANQGVAIIMISSELPEVLGMSDRVIVMHEGHIKGQLSREEADQVSIMKMAVS